MNVPCARAMPGSLSDSADAPSVRMSERSA